MFEASTNRAALTLCCSGLFVTVVWLVGWMVESRSSSPTSQSLSRHNSGPTATESYDMRALRLAGRLSRIKRRGTAPRV